MEKLFRLKENHTTVRTEVIAGITTFMTMAYILAVNPNILSASGMNAEAVLIATCLASFVGCFCMAFFANYPFALAPGLGLNAYFSFSVCLGMGYDWRIALLAVFVEGLVFIVLSVTKFREAVFFAISASLKKGVTAGIGLFIAFIGFQGAHLVVNSNSTLVTVVDFRDAGNAGVCAMLALVGLCIIIILNVKNVKAAVLVGILVTWILGMGCEALGIYVPDPENGFYSVYPSLGITNFSSIGLVFGQAFFADWSNVSVINFIVVVFSFLFVDFFDTIGTLIGCADKAKFLDKKGSLKNIRGALLADAVATSLGAVFGTSTTTTIVESSAGVSVGGRTGLTAVTTGLLFLLSIFFAPVFTAIPGFATAPALIFVGFLMLTSILQLNFMDIRESFPAYVAMISMPLMYSISEGISLGILSYVVINGICNLTGEKKPITPLMYVLAVVLLCKYFFL